MYNILNEVNITGWWKLTAAEEVCPGRPES